MLMAVHHTYTLKELLKQVMIMREGHSVTTVILHSLHWWYPLSLGHKRSAKLDSEVST